MGLWGTPLTSCEVECGAYLGHPPGKFLSFRLLLESLEKCRNVRNKSKYIKSRLSHKPLEKQIVVFLSALMLLVSLSILAK